MGEEGADSDWEWAFGHMSSKGGFRLNPYLGDLIVVVVVAREMEMNQCKLLRFSLCGVCEIERESGWSTRLIDLRVLLMCLY